jgi:hypothetical protein
MRKKETYISFREEPDFAERVNRAAAKEERTVSDFVRRLVRIALDEFEEVGSLQAMKSRRERALLARQTTISRGVHDERVRAKVPQKDKSDRIKESA